MINIRQIEGDRVKASTTPTHPLCYVAHPLGAGSDRENNRRLAAEILCQLQETYPEKVFVASWITLASVWPDSTRYRDIGIAADLALIEHCQELWLCGPRISPGMAAELTHAEKLGLVIVDRLAPLQLTERVCEHHTIRTTSAGDLCWDCGAEL